MSVKGEIIEALTLKIDGVGPKRAREIVDVLVRAAEGLAERFELDELETDPKEVFLAVLAYIKEMA